MTAIAFVQQLAFCPANLQESPLPAPQKGPDRTESISSVQLCTLSRAADLDPREFKLAALRDGILVCVAPAEYVPLNPEMLVIKLDHFL